MTEVIDTTAVESKDEPRPVGPQIAIHQIVLDAAQECDVYLHEPGIVRHVAIGGEVKRVTGLTGKPQIQERLILFVEVDANAPRRKRTFLQMAPGQSFAPRPGVRAEWCGCGLSVNTGAVVYVFEIVENAA